MRTPAFVVALILAGLLGRAGDALAQPGMTPIEPAAPAGPPPEQRPLRSESTALWLSLGGTLASWTMVAAASKLHGDDGAPLDWAGVLGTYLAPTFGHWYAGARVTRGLGIRTVGLATMFIGLTRSICADVDEDVGLGGSGCSEDGPRLLLAGLVIYVGGTIDDLLSVPGRVRKRNQRIQGLALAPLVAPHTSGLALAGSF
jgi:hypothetical protein